MKIEKRGKYAGVKVHLEPDECEPFVKLVKDAASAGVAVQQDSPTYFSLAFQLGKKINKLMADEPSLMSPRTEDEIKHELEVELESAQKKLAALTNNQDWKGIHIK